MSDKSNVLYLNLLEDLDWALTSHDYGCIAKGDTLELKSGESVQKAAAKSLINAFFKKNIDDVSSSADSAALEKFVSANNYCANFKSLRHDPGAEVWHEELYGEFIRCIHKFFQPLAELSFGSILDKGRLGPGSNVGTKYTDFYSKMFSSNLTATNDVLYQVYKAWAKESDRHGCAEDFRAATFGECSLVEGNRLSFVPKTTMISRTICAEPTLNMYFQLGLGAHIEDRLKEVYKIDLSFQSSLNKLMAARTQDGEPVFATIDLESASDTISLGLIDDIMPASFAAWLHLFRSPKVLLPNQEWLQLKMVSSMGNGFTFPLQTAIFACLVNSVFRYRERRFVRNRLDRSGRHVYLNYGNFGVFGDDIIVPNDLFGDTCHLLERCGFKVNRSKSFSMGVFRESCGSDYFRGQNVRGVYCKTLRTTQARYSLLNRLLVWQSHHRIDLWRTTRMLLDSVPDLRVPAWESDDSGIRVPRSLVKHLLRDKHTQAIQYRRWVTVIPKLRFMEDRIVGPRREKPRIFNKDGVVLFLLTQKKGTGGTIGLRPASLRYRKEKSICPNWDQLEAFSGQERLEFDTWSKYVSKYLD